MRRVKMRLAEITEDGINALLSFTLNQIFFSELQDFRFHPLLNRKAYFSLKNTPLGISVTCHEKNDRHFLQASITNKARTNDVTITTNLLSYAKLLTKRTDPDTLFFQRKLTLEGDTELGHFIKNTLDSCELELLFNRIINPSRSK